MKKVKWKILIKAGMGIVFFAGFILFSATDVQAQPVDPGEITVSGACGSAKNQTFSSAPTTNLCLYTWMTASAVTLDTSTWKWKWTCTGSPGATVNCTAIAAPLCGSSNNQSFNSAPTSNLCSTGIASSVSGSGPWSWTCTTGSSVSCSATKAAVPGACGTLGTTTTALAEGYTTFSGNSVCKGASCIPGLCANYNTPSGSNLPTGSVFDCDTLYWGCTGQNGGEQAYCNRAVKVDAICGPANHQSRSIIPTDQADLCTFKDCKIFYPPTNTNGGTQADPWKWICCGANGGNPCYGMACNTYHYWQYDASVANYYGKCVPYACQGVLPTNAAVWYGDNIDLLNNTISYSYSASNTGTMCQFYCNSGYIWKDGACVNAYSCQGTVPANASMFDKDNVGLTVNTDYSYSPSDTGTRCQYSCNAGYTWNGTNTCIKNPTVDLTANPPSVSPGGFPTLSWTVTDATSCTASGGTPGGTWISNIDKNVVSGSEKDGPINGNTTYTLTCKNAYAETSDSVTVSIVGPLKVDLTLTGPPRVTSGSNADLSWTVLPAATAKSCTASGGNFTGSKDVSAGTATVGPINEPTTFTLTCLNALDIPASDSVTVNTCNIEYQCVAVEKECPPNLKQATTVAVPMACIDAGCDKGYAPDDSFCGGCSPIEIDCPASSGGDDDNEWIEVKP